ncbi:hypothetical protein KIMC2_18650 [Xylocopilactobacillus apis]|uniref:Uncharacterized protein n=1 Tax=Xylocopilactobacillus apis TaxID=2932183 RepID=A0AAU9DU00_9LACO|nr:hypothetical protein KIMC2_18650 [Xylocopilactobacillus apis]
MWEQQKTIDEKNPTIIVTEAYRLAEYERSEFISPNKKSKVISLGTFHYLQWEEPKK